MFEFSLDFITGLSFGIELPDVSDIPDINWALVIDIAIIRLQFVSWKTAE